MKIYNTITELTGNTPLIRLSKIKEDFHLQANLIGKAEFCNPTGSVKDRIARAMIEDAEQSGKINENTVIIEPTSGNTGIGLAALAAARGYHVIFTMPESMSLERRNLLKAFGAELVLTEASKGMHGAIKKAEALAETYENAFIPSQFENPVNPQTHFKTTGPEIWNDTDGNVDMFVAGIGTGGTISGIGRYLKSRNPEIQVIGVEPAGSPFLSQGIFGPHQIQGIGAGFEPETLDKDVYDALLTVEDEAAIKTAKLLAMREGILAGISAGAALFGAIQAARKPENAGKTIVVLLPDTGERYLSTALFNDDLLE